MVRNPSPHSEFVLNLVVDSAFEVKSRDFVLVFVCHESMHFYGHGRAEVPVFHAEFGLCGTGVLKDSLVTSCVGRTLIRH